MILESSEGQFSPHSFYGMNWLALRDIKGGITF